MPRDIPIGNQSLLIIFDRDYRLCDFYFPHVGMENHSGGNPFRLGAWADGKFSWMGREWNPQLKYLPESLVTDVTAANEALNIELACNDVVDYKECIYIKRIVVRNRADREREVRIFLHHDFHILGSAAGDTAYYDPDQNAIIHYKEQRYFLAGGQANGKPGFDQYSTGVKEFHNLEGTWRDAEDGVLAGNPIAQGSVDSVIGFTLRIPAGGEQVIYYWIGAGTNYQEVVELHQMVMARGVEHFIKRTGDYWRSWLNKEEFNLANLPQNIKALYKQSLLILNTNIDENGAIIAANDSDTQDFSNDSYSYAWLRDGAFAAHALDLAGYIGSARRFFDFCLGIVSKGKEAGGYFLHKYNPDGSLGSSWHSWVNLGAGVLPIQEDETGLVLWALWSHFDKFRDIEFLNRHYHGMIARCGDFLASYRDKSSGLPLPSYDLWEESLGVHTFTVAAVYAGLVAAGRFAQFYGDGERAASYQKAADEIKEATVKYLYDAEHGRFLRALHPQPDGSMAPDVGVDASLFALCYLGMFEPGDERVIGTMHAIREKLWINTEVGGIARYENDGYFRDSADAALQGNPWFICTLWYVQWLIAKAGNLNELHEANPYLERIARMALPSGVMAEQVNPRTGAPVSASPLSWSHATFVATVQEYLAKLEELYICPRCGRPMYRHDRGGREQHSGKEWRKIHQQQEAELGHPLTYVTRGEVEYQGQKATIMINHNTCVGATMCAFSCPVEIFELVNDKSHLVAENLPKCLLQTCMLCKNNCPTHSVHIIFHDGVVEGSVAPQAGTDEEAK